MPKARPLKTPKTSIAVDVDGNAIVQGITGSVLNAPLLEAISKKYKHYDDISYINAVRNALHPAPPIYLFTTADMTQVDGARGGMHALLGATRARVKAGFNNLGVTIKGTIVSAAALTSDPVHYGNTFIENERAVLKTTGLDLEGKLKNNSPLAGKKDGHLQTAFIDLTKRCIKPNRLIRVIQDWFFSHLINEIFSGKYHLDNDPSKLPSFPGPYIDGDRSEALKSEFETVYPQAASGYYVRHPEPSKRDFLQEYLAVCNGWQKDPSFCERINNIIDFFNKISWPQHLSFEQRFKIFGHGKGHMLLPWLEIENSVERIIIFDDKAEVIGLAQILNASENQEIMKTPVGKERYFVACQVNDSLDWSNTKERYTALLETQKKFCSYTNEASRLNLGEFGKEHTEVVTQDNLPQAVTSPPFNSIKTFVERLNEAWDATFDIQEPHKRSNLWVYLNRPEHGASKLEKFLYFTVGLPAEFVLAFMRLVLVATPALILAGLDHIKQEIYNSGSLGLLFLVAPLVLLLKLPFVIMHRGLDMALSPVKYWKRAEQIENLGLRTIARTALVLYFLAFWAGLSVALPGFAFGKASSAAAHALSLKPLFSGIAAGLSAMGANLVAIFSTFSVLLLATIKLTRLAFSAPVIPVGHISLFGKSKKQQYRARDTAKLQARSGGGSPSATSAEFSSETESPALPDKNTSDRGVVSDKISAMSVKATELYTTGQYQAAFDKFLMVYLDTLAFHKDRFNPALATAAYNVSSCCLKLTSPSVEALKKGYQCAQTALEIRQKLFADNSEPVKKACDRVAEFEARLESMKSQEEEPTISTTSFSFGVGLSGESTA